MSESASANESPVTTELPTTPAASDAPGSRPARSWSTRTLAAAAVAALVIGGGGGVALGAMSSGGDSDRGAGGRGNFQRPPGGQQGQGPRGGPMPQQGTMPPTP